MERTRDDKKQRRRDSGTFTIPMLVLTIALVIGIAVLAVFLRAKFCGAEEPAGQDGKQQGQASAQTPDNGVPDDVLQAYLKKEVEPKGTTSFAVGSLQHGVDKLKKTDTVTFVLTETRPDGVYRARHIVSFVYDEQKREWTVKKHDQTTEERIGDADAPGTSVTPPTQEAQTTTPPPATTPPATTPPSSEELPGSFTFGGAVIKRGETGITGSKRGINGSDASNMKHITAEEVEMLVRMCPDLEVLDLDCCYMDDYAPLGRLTKLKKLVLTHCGSGGKGNRIRSIEWIRELKDLQILYLTHNGISDLSPLAGLPMLEELRLGDNRLTDDSLAGLSDLKNLKLLSLNANGEIGSLSKLPTLENLRFIDLSVCPSLKTVSGLKKQPKLKMLKLDNSGLTSLGGVADQPELVEIDVSGCSLASSEYRKLESCPKLEYVVIKEKDKDANKAMDTVEQNNSRISRLYKWKYIGG